MTLSKEAQGVVKQIQTANEELQRQLKEERFQSSLKLQALTDDLQTIDVLVQHALSDIHQVKNLDGQIDRAFFHATEKLLEAIETLTKDYR